MNAWTPGRATHEVRTFYAYNAPIVLGYQICCTHTWHFGLRSRDMEIAAAKSRSDIGRVEWRTVGGRWTEA